MDGINHSQMGGLCVNYITLPNFPMANVVKKLFHPSPTAPQLVTIPTVTLTAPPGSLPHNELFMFLGQMHTTITELH